MRQGGNSQVQKATEVIIYVTYTLISPRYDISHFSVESAFHIHHYATDLCETVIFTLIYIFKIYVHMYMHVHLFLCFYLFDIPILSRCTRSNKKNRI